MTIVNLEITFEVFQDLVRLLTEVGSYTDDDAYGVIGAAMNGSEWAIEVIERTILMTEEVDQAI